MAFLSGIVFLVLAYRFLRANKTAYQANRAVMPSFTSGLNGDAKTWDADGRRNPRTASGLAYRDGKLVPKGKLTSEAKEEIFS